ncbi:mitogen-activated protein kinase kinase kinase 12 [Biomphalaria glabrata]|nr:mitogen-activated protein kinase kinase kinase 12 [Biomphalaria glabrata]
MRARKSCHRRNNSRGSMKDITSPLKSQSTYEASLDTQTSDKLNLAGLHPTDHAPYPGTFKFLGPATAIREYQSEDEADGQETRLTTLKNVKFVVAKTHPLLLLGTCQSQNFFLDATCSSKRSSQVSADVESICDQSPMPSPKQNMETMSEKSSPDIDLSS